MSRRRYLAILLILIAAIALAASSAKSITLPSTEELIAAVPGATSFTHELSPIDYYKMLDANGHTVGAAFLTSSVPPEVSGYGGEIEVLVGIDMSGRITGTKLMAHNEGPEYMQRLIGQGFFSRFLGKNAQEVAGVEAVSGATISSQAVIDDVRTAAAAVFAELSGQSKAGAAVRFGRRLPLIHAGAIIIMIALCAAAVLLQGKDGSDASHSSCRLS